MSCAKHPFVEHELAFYAWAAPTYDTAGGGVHVRAAERLAELAAVQPTEDVLDVGCGTGLVTHRMQHTSNPSRWVLGVDLSPEMLAQAESSRPAQSLASFSPMDACHLVFRDASFDVATMGQVLPYLLEPEAALAEARRVLRPHGRLAVSCQRRSLCTPAENQFFGFLEEMGGGFRIPRPPQHHAFFGEPWALEGLLEANGFEVGATTQLLVGNHTPNARAWMEMMMLAGPYPNALLGMLQPAAWERVERRIEETMHELGPNAYRYHRSFTFVVARRR